MKRDEIISRATKAAKTIEDPRVGRVLGFLARCGLLLVNKNFKRVPRRLKIVDAYWVGANVEPRVFAVLPLVALHFPNRLDGVIPKNLLETVTALREGQQSGPDFYGVSYGEIFKLAQLPVKDRRVKSLGAKRTLKAFRLKQSVIARLSELSARNGCSMTESLERLIEQAGKS